MKKNIIALFFVLSLCLSLPACTSSDTTNNVEIDYGSSTLFSEAEIESAVDAVLAKFRDFEGCELKRLWYDEEMSDSIIERDIASSGENTIKNSGAGPENVIILFSDFYVDSSGGDGSFNPDSTYTDWIWILIRDNENGKWSVDDWGY